MNNPNRPAASKIADSNKPPTSEDSPNARFHYLLVDDLLDIPNMCYLGKRDMVYVRLR